VVTYGLIAIGLGAFFATLGWLGLTGRLLRRPLEDTVGNFGDVAVLDLGAQGLWRPARGQDDGLSWSPVRSAAVWAALGRLFAVTLDDGPAEPSS
jgi:hypothetical protein